MDQDAARQEGQPDIDRGGGARSPPGGQPRSAASADKAAEGGGGMGLSARLLVLMLVFALAVEALVFVPAMTAFRRSWLNDRLSAAQIAALVLEAAPDASVSPAIEEKLLNGVGVMGIALSGGGARHLLSNDTMPTEVLRTYDMRDASWAAQMHDTLADLTVRDDDAIRVIGDGMGDIAFVELIMDPAPLRSAMLAFAVRVAGVSLLVWGATAVALYLALMRLIVRPVRRLAVHITAFEREPGNPERIIVPSGNGDEIGAAERALERMERTLATELRQQQRLAALGLAVSKISHELRNLLTAAQLMSDRLAQVSDPVVERFAPRLIATLDRAIAFCESALSYGRVNEALPQRRPIKLLPLIDELRDNLGLGDHPGIRLVADIPADLTLDADPDQISRVLLNLGRNAVQALEQDLSAVVYPVPGSEPPPLFRTISVSARTVPADGNNASGGRGKEVLIRFADDGPGLSPPARDRLFEAFRGTTRPGGSGLGLPIAAELIRLHGGSITLEPDTPGACFVIRLPAIGG
ncbi:ATP-binding protein [Pseudochelatococcus sp. B33]